VGIIIKNNLIECGQFTENKVYDVIGIGEGYYKILDDDGNSDWLGTEMIKEKV